METYKNLIENLEVMIKLLKDLNKTTDFGACDDLMIEFDEIKSAVIEELEDIDKKRGFKDEEICVPIYFYEKDNKVIIDIEGITKEFNRNLDDVIRSPKKYLEIW